MILRFFCPSRFLRRSGHIALPGLSYRFIRLSCAPFPWATPPQLGERRHPARSSRMVYGAAARLMQRGAAYLPVISATEPGG